MSPQLLGAPWISSYNTAAPVTVSSAASCSMNSFRQVQLHLGLSPQLLGAPWIASDNTAAPRTVSLAARCAMNFFRRYSCPCDCLLSCQLLHELLQTIQLQLGRLLSCLAARCAMNCFRQYSCPCDCLLSCQLRHVLLQTGTAAPGNVSSAATVPWIASDNTAATGTISSAANCPVNGFRQVLLPLVLSP
jgi:uncharacterized Fe-S cluster protein YjdI